ncbi:tRNA lysidine(34) synthetase TilS [Desulfobulbus alkaliphilus]|uniref:tRNA lysidine(34) synthetase TilS n=1 Tax=Desulfobulbus alkaliphilus TaxID=869814 RepID=UPI001963F48C|nr:tRNA lysidine(34) synthetase TilS [Desulfobulbus alkaliphilus]MBM9537632.1 tRNA lysidine(34) synthetase TilS [Desulfobulbus alkaliphilus]
MHSLEKIIYRLLHREIAETLISRVLVGVSGGPDSMALLHILAAMRPHCSLTLVAAYIDHGLRPGETPAEWACVRAAAADLQLDCTMVTVDAAAVAIAGKFSPEQAAREVRYRAFADLVHARQLDLVAVAHTADDQSEEVLLRLLRGGGRRALSGMRYRSGTLIRPLLGIRKAELMAYLAEKDIHFCHDSSNDDMRFLRNRIRHELLPLLEERYDSGIRRALLKTAANLGEDEDLLERLLAGSWEETVVIETPDMEGEPVCRLDRSRFRALHPALQRRLIEKLLWTMGTTTRYEHVMAVLAAGREGRPGSELHLSQGLRIEVSREQVLFSYPLGKGPWRGSLKEY